MTVTNRSRTPDPGKYRAIQQVTSDDGFFEICALDHLAEFTMLLDPDPAKVSFDEVVAAKSELITELGPIASAVLLDARFSMHSLLTRQVPRGTGIISALEDETYTFPKGPRGTQLRAGWDAQKIKLAGGGMGKLLWFYRPDLDQDVAQQQRDLLRTVQADCDSVSLPLVVEPIWFSVDGEDPTSESWKRARIDGILRSARDADEIGVDLLKVEFPGYMTSAADIDQARDACAELDGSISVPWVILSAGVNFQQFTEQVEIACTAGASGYMAGRSVWSDAVSRDLEARERGLLLAKERLVTLNEITRKLGTPFVPVQALDVALEAMPDGWYRNWPSA